MATVEPDGDAVAGLDAQETNTIYSLSSTLSLPPSAQTDLLISYPDFKASPLSEPVFGVGGDELLPEIDDFQLLLPHPYPRHGPGPADINFMLAFDVESHERFWEEVMGPVEDAPGYLKTYSPADEGSPSPLSITQHLPMEVAVAENPNPTTDLNFVAPLLLLNTSTSEPTTPWSRLWSQESPSTSTFLSQPSPKPQIDSISTTPCSPSIFPILCSWEECGKAFLTNTALNHHLKYHIRPFQCPHCPLQQATKRLLHRHINERHFNTEKYYCTVDGCNRSLAGDLGSSGRHFTREDNCRRHLRKVHGISEMREVLGGKMARQAKNGGESGVVDMDELTRRIRKERKVGRTKMG